MFFLVMLVSPFISGQTNFEGKISYNITYEPINPNATVEFLEQNYGTKEILLYRKGYYKRIKLNRLNDTVSVVIFNPKTKMIHGSHISMKDTIMVYPATENVMASYRPSKVENRSIAGNETYGVKYNFKYKPESKSGGPKSPEITYYFSKKHPVKAKWHKNQKDGFYNEIMRDNPYLILMVINDDKWIKIETKTAIEIQPMKINKNLFKIDESKPLKEI